AAAPRLDARLPAVYRRVAQGLRSEHRDGRHGGPPAVPRYVALPLRLGRSLPHRRGAYALPGDIRHASRGTLPAARGALAVKPRLSFWQMYNMSFGFLGIQFGWGLQLANMSAVYERLGARPDQVPLLWLAAPLTGLLVQPIVGALSDRTWGRLGRRRPYFLTGAILASIALFLMPTSSALWMAAGLLWILDASINISMEPFRAFVADKLDVSQRTAGFVMQSFFIGVGASLANALPLLFSWMGVRGSTASGVPLSGPRIRSRRCTRRGSSGAASASPSTRSLASWSRSRCRRWLP